ncbi:MAG: helix-turn-helix domain-containing protein [Defluviitaleaceae bacterium]|nr:helix-turn-helix domain-containing protein [Defluviitaleaceae bacterium]
MYDKTVKIFPDRLRKARDDKKWSQTDLGKEVNMVQSTISEYERGKIFPTLAIIFRFAEKLDKSPAWLLGLSEESTAETGHEKMINLLIGMMESNDSIWKVDFDVQRVEQGSESTLGVVIHTDDVHYRDFVIAYGRMVKAEKNETLEIVYGDKENSDKAKRANLLLKESAKEKYTKILNDPERHAKYPRAIAAKQ